MPRTKLDVITPERQREITNKIIKHAMVEAGIKTPTELAPLIRMRGETVRRRFRIGGWTIEELQTLVRVLKICAEDAAKMLGCRSVA